MESSLARSFMRSRLALIRRRRMMVASAWVATTTAMITSAVTKTKNIIFVLLRGSGRPQGHQKANPHKPPSRKPQAIHEMKAAHILGSRQKSIPSIAQKISEWLRPIVRACLNSSKTRSDMPSTSKKQARFMKAVAHGFKPDGKKAPPLAVAKEFMRADMAKKAKRPRKRTIAEGY